MHFLFILVPVTFWQVVGADSDSCSSSATISSQSDANTYAHCDQIDGSITISPSASGSIVLYNVTEIKGSFIAEGASEVTTLTVPDLETIQGALTVDGMSSLSNLSMNSLSEVSSAVTVTGNAKLKYLEFEDLEEVDGELKLTGSFISVSLPSLDQVKGQTIIRGGSSMLCTALDSLSDVFESAYSCSASSGSSLSAGTKGGIAVGVIIAVLLILLLAWWIIRQRRARRRRTSKTAALSPSICKDEKPSPPHYQPIPSGDLSPKVPRKPVGPAPALLDGRSIYEAAYPASPIPVYHELDAGPVFGTHQRPIHSES